MATATGYMDESSDDQYPYSLVREALHDSCSTSGICKPQTAWLVRGFLATRLMLPSIFKILDWEIHCMVCPHASRVLTRVPLPVYVNPKLHDMCRGFWRLALFCLQFFLEFGLSNTLHGLSACLFCFNPCCFENCHYIYLYGMTHASGFLADHLFSMHGVVVS